MLSKPGELLAALPFTADEGGLAPVPPSEASAGYLIREANRAFTRALQARIAPLGVNIGMWFFLCALWEEDGISQRELSQRVGMMEPTTVTALNNMEKRGIVTRRRNAEDRRVVNVFLTEYGRSLKDKLIPCAAEVNTAARQGILPEDMRVLTEVLTRIRANLDAGRS
jgi:DNA-binding MarR family transcriptional regulator